MTGRDRKGSGSGRTTTHTPLMSEHDRAVLAAGRRRTKVKIGGETREVSVIEALAMRTSQSALEGNSHAQWLAYKMFSEAEQKAEAERAAERLALEQLFLRQTRLIRAAIVAGEQTDLILPHPEDIDFSTSTGPAIRGPASEAEWREALVTARIRDAWLKQDALNRALAGRLRKPDFVPFDGGCLAIMANLSLPPRLRLTESEFVTRRMADAVLPMRVLLKECRATWKAAGCDMPRGSPSPASETVRDLFQMLVSAVTRFREGGMNPRQIPVIERQANEEVAAIFRRARQQSG